LPCHRFGIFLSARGAPSMGGSSTIVGPPLLRYFVSFLLRPQLAFFMAVCCNLIVLSCFFPPPFFTGFFLLFPSGLAVRFESWKFSIPGMTSSSPSSCPKWCTEGRLCFHILYASPILFTDSKTWHTPFSHMWVPSPAVQSIFFWS